MCNRGTEEIVDCGMDEVDIAKVNIESLIIAEGVLEDLTDISNDEDIDIEELIFCALAQGVIQ